MNVQCGLSVSVPTDLVNRASRPDQTTKIFRTGTSGPGPDLPETECDETCQILTMLNAHVWFVSQSLLLSFYKVLFILER